MQGSAAVWAMYIGSAAQRRADVRAELRHKPSSRGKSWRPRSSRYRKPNLNCNRRTWRRPLAFLSAGVLAPGVKHRALPNPTASEGLPGRAAELQSSSFPLSLRPGEGAAAFGAVLPPATGHPKFYTELRENLITS